MKMKLLAACAVLLTGMSQASAQEVWGDASAGFGYYSVPDFDYNETYLDAGGRVLLRFNNGFNIQGAAFVGNDFENDVGFGGVNTDVFFANSMYAAGVYLGVFTNSDSYTNYFAGGQAVGFFGNVDVGAYAGWESNDGNDNLEAGTWLIGYLTPNTALGGGLFWEGNDDFDVYGVEVYGEHRFAGSPFSIWANFSYAQISDVFDTESYNTRVGATYFFDPAGTTLQDHNRVMPF